MNTNKDLLETMFALQAELNRRIGVDTTALPEEKKADDVYTLYCSKHRVNHARQDSGYTEKDGNDNRGLE